ncbi:MAG TPA: OmpA family protein [Polyangia bacterium]|nr:OmpA family protein [Polyangia bacterium]
MSHGAVESQSLVALLAGQVSPDLIHRAASELGESDERTRSAVSTGIPSVLATLSDAATSPDGASRLSSIIKRVELGSEGATAGSRLGSAAGLEEGAVLFDAEAGGRAGPLALAVARTTGVRPDSARKLLGGLTGTAVVAMRRSYGELAPEELQSLLGQQRGELVGRLPDPIASVFDGDQAPAPRPARAARAKGPAIRELPAANRRAGGALPMLVLSSVFLLGLWLLRSFHRPPSPAVAARPAASAQAYLPAGPALSPAAAPTSALEGFLAGSGATPARFNVAPMNFETGAAQPMPDSIKTIEQVAATLLAHPTAQIRVESYTDSMGSQEANQRLSETRSRVVKDLLVQHGVSSSRIQVQGRGQANPIESNGTAEGRATNRRTEIVVTSR